MKLKKMDTRNAVRGENGGLLGFELYQMWNCSQLYPRRGGGEIAPPMSDPSHTVYIFESIENFMHIIS